MKGGVGILENLILHFPKLKHLSSEPGSGPPGLGGTRRSAPSGGLESPTAVSFGMEERKGFLWNPRGRGRVHVGGPPAGGGGVMLARGVGERRSKLN